jgi:hypothetical protein
MYIYVYLNGILKKVCTYLNGDQFFFFTFPTSEGSDLLSSHVMQTPTFISKLSDGNVIFRLDVGKTNFKLCGLFTLYKRKIFCHFLELLSVCLSVCFVLIQKLIDQFSSNKIC